MSKLNYNQLKIMKIKLTTIKVKEVEIPKTSDLVMLIEAFNKMKKSFILEHQCDMEDDFGIRFQFSDEYSKSCALYFNTKFKLITPTEEDESFNGVDYE